MSRESISLPDIIKKVIIDHLEQESGGKMEMDGKILFDRDSNWGFDPAELAELIFKEIS